VTPDPTPEPEPVVELAIAAPVVDLAAPAALALIEARATELASERAALIVAEREHESELVSFAARMVGGDTEHPRGLTVGHDRLTAFLRALPVSLYPEAVAILSDAAEHSPVEYSEAGHSRVLHGVRQLPDVIKPALQSWIKAGLSLESFFETNSVELGNMTDYNLSEYQGE
jgi:hypothetical protein